MQNRYQNHALDLSLDHASGSAGTTSKWLPTSSRKGRKCLRLLVSPGRGQTKLFPYQSPGRSPGFGRFASSMQHASLLEPEAATETVYHHGRDPRPKFAKACTLRLDLPGTYSSSSTVGLRK